MKNYFGHRRMKKILYTKINIYIKHRNGRAFSIAKAVMQLMKEANSEF